MTTSETDWDVIVVGGGLAGLSAGATAARSGLRALVLEGHLMGGRARVFERDGFTFNLGAHALSVNGPGWEVLRQLGVTPVGAAPPLDRYRLWYRGQAHQMPSDLVGMLRTTALDARSKAQLARLLAGVPRMKPDRWAGVSVTEWLGDRDLRPDAAAVARAFVRIATYSDDHDDLSADVALHRLQSAARGVVYLDGGWAQLTNGLAAQVQTRAHVAVSRLEPGPRRIAVVTAAGTLTAAAVVLALGSPGVTRALLPSDPGWGDLGEPVTAACLDVACGSPPSPGYVLGVDQPVYATTQSPPARQAPDGQAVVSVVRYGARSAAQDRPELESYLAHAGVAAGDVRFERFLARLAVSATQPRARRGGLVGRPGIGDTGLAHVFLAGDWVGRSGLLADAALASGHEAGLAAARSVGDTARVAA